MILRHSAKIQEYSQCHKLATQYLKGSVNVELSDCSDALMSFKTMLLVSLRIVSTVLALMRM
jgi:hypothetical protein